MATLLIFVGLILLGSLLGAVVWRIPVPDSACRGELQVGRTVDRASIGQAS